MLYTFYVFMHCNFTMCQNIKKDDDDDDNSEEMGKTEK